MRCSKKLKYKCFWYSVKDGDKPHWTNGNLHIFKTFGLEPWELYSDVHMTQYLGAFFTFDAACKAAKEGK